MENGEANARAVLVARLELLEMQRRAIYTRPELYADLGVIARWQELALEAATVKSAIRALDDER
jgi:hypothetical protein